MLSRAINKALRRPAPETIPLSGPRSSSNDFFSVRFDLEGGLVFLIKEPGQTAYPSLVWDESEVGRDVCFLLDRFGPLKGDLEIEHFYKGYRFSYSSPFWFWVAFSISWHRFRVFLSKLDQKLYNKRSLIREERMDLLRYLVERRIQNPNEQVHPLLLGAQRHSRKWVLHPNRDEHAEYLRLLLESFYISGDMERKGSTYVVTAKALETLSDYDREVQRHQDQLRTSRVGNALTWAIVIVGLVGIFSRFLMWNLEQGTV